MRFFANPVYPYNDNGIIEAYRSLSTKYLRWERVHVAQLAYDSRFNSVNSTRLNLSVKQELRLLSMMGWMRRFETLSRHNRKGKPTPSAEKDESLRRTLSEFGINGSIWGQLSKLPKTQGFYQTIANLIAALRIKHCVEKWSPSLSLK